MDPFDPNRIKYSEVCCKASPLTFVSTFFLSQGGSERVSRKGQKFSAVIQGCGVIEGKMSWRRFFLELKSVAFGPVNR